MAIWVSEELFNDTKSIDTHLKEILNDIAVLYEINHPDGVVDLFEAYCFQVMSKNTFTRKDLYDDFITIVKLADDSYTSINRYIAVPKEPLLTFCKSALDYIHS